MPKNLGKTQAKSSSSSKRTSNQLPKSLKIGINTIMKKEGPIHTEKTQPKEKEENQPKIIVHETENGEKIKVAKKHTWIYDELFIKRGFADESFDEYENIENASPAKRQLLLNKYNILMRDIEEMQKEIKLLKEIIENDNHENEQLELEIQEDIRNYKDLIEKYLRMSFELTKVILGLKKLIKEAEEEEG